jgi:ribonuclease BN (tRNA processing enzyme)
MTDLVTLLFALRNQYLGRVKPLKITGPEGLKDYYRGLQCVYGHWVEEEGYDLELIELGEGEIRRDGYTLNTRNVLHTPSSLAFRLESPDGKSLVYSGDTDYCEGILELGRGSRTMLLECSVPEEERAEGHLTPTLAGQIASECGAKKLILTHFYPLFVEIDIVDRVRKVFDGEVVLAKDMMKIEID